MNERIWPYKISEKKFENLVKRVSRFYCQQIDLPGYVLTLMEEKPNIDMAEAYRILSDGNGAGKSHMSNIKELQVLGNFRHTRKSRCISGHKKRMFPPKLPLT